MFQFNVQMCISNVIKAFYGLVQASQHKSVDWAKGISCIQIYIKTGFFSNPNLNLSCLNPPTS